MTNINVSLPEPMRDWVEAQIKAGRYGNLSEYVRELIRGDQKRRAQERLEELLIEGLESGPAKEMTKEDWDALKERLVERHKRKTAGGER